ncbi:MAG: primosomal protein N' [Bacteroidetes bacterium]|nr:primosomal protein N' [Bacteroidota bacterium]
MERATLFAEVLLPLSLDKTYTYRIPEELNEEAVPGKRVVVQFGKRKIYAGIIQKLGDKPPVGYEARYILHILDDTPLLDEHDLRFWEWLAAYYMGNPGDIMALALPAALRLQSESIIVLHPETRTDELPELSEEEHRIIDLLLKHPYLVLDKLPELAEIKNPLKFIKSLYERGLILIKEDISEHYTPKTTTMLRLADSWQDEVFAKETLDALERRAPKQSDIILSLLGSAGQPQEKQSWMKAHGLSEPALKTLAEKGLVILYKEQISRLKLSAVQGNNETTSPEISHAVEHLNQLLQQQQVALLHGPKGSGKTSTTMALCQQILNEGRQVLILQPEAALTQQYIARWEARFGKDLLVWHGKYSHAERYELWEKVRQGGPCVVLGSRGAIFLPFRNTGLFVVDEEHDSSYKQIDRRPYIHARDALIMLAHQRKCPCLLVSATPSAEVWYQTQEGRYARMEAPFSEQVPQVKVHLVDTGTLRRNNEMQGIFSPHAVKEIYDCLEAGNQVIVYHNRKGFVPWIRCESCNWRPRCVQCDVTLTYYKSSSRNLCNYCGHQEVPQRLCPACGSNKISMQGYGTERIAEELNILFPEAHISRLDQETARSRKEMQRIVDGFVEQKTDILVGSHFLTRGMELGEVGISIIPDADQAMYLPDFRAHERAYQQFVQVLAHTGSKGIGILQSYQVGHPLFADVVKGDAASFYDRELPMRRNFLFPPYTRMIRLEFRHKDAQVSLQAAESFIKTFPAGKEVAVNGPVKPHISRIRNQFIQQVVLRIPRNHPHPAQVKEQIRAVVRGLLGQSTYKRLQCSADVDPQ